MMGSRPNEGTILDDGRDPRTLDANSVNDGGVEHYDNADEWSCAGSEVDYDLVSGSDEDDDSECESPHWKQASNQNPQGFAANFSVAQQEQIRDSLPQEGPHRAEFRKIMRAKPSDEYLAITKGKGSLFTEELKRNLASLTSTVAPHQFRAYALGGTGRSGGFSSPQVYLCNSSRNGIKTSRKLEDMPIKDASTMLAAHLCWIGRREDEFLSWTSSLSLALTIAFVRHEKGQKHVYVAWGNTRKLRTPDGDQASFYPALGLQLTLPPVLGNIFGLSNRTLCKLKAQHFTQEAVAFGDMLDPETAIQHVLLEDLVKNGLLELIPELVIDDPFLGRNGLYNHCIWMKRKLFHYSEAENISQDVLVLCDRLASCFKCDDDAKAPFWCFITLLSLRLRPMTNSAFRDWINQHYNEKDIMEGIDCHVNTPADNLPDVKQAMMLAREAAGALGLKPNPVPELTPITDYTSMDRYAEAELKCWPLQCRDWPDSFTQHLIDEPMYGPDQASLQARRDFANCNEELAALLKLARLADKKNDHDNSGTKLGLTGIQATDAESDNLEIPKRPEQKSLAEEVADIMEEDKRREEEKKQKEAQRKKEAEKKALQGRGKISNRQSRTELNKKYGLLSPSEQRRMQKVRVRQARLRKSQRRLYGKILEQRLAEGELEMIAAPQPRRKKSDEERRADLLRLVERISGQLYRRETSRQTIAELYDDWEEQRTLFSDSVS